MNQTQPLPPLIWHLSGSDQDGPNVTILGGTHGDELTGIELVRTWLKTIDPSRNLLNLPPGHYQVEGIRGNVFIGFANPEAIVRCTRAASSVRDLNRCFDPDLLASLSSFIDLERARQLWPLLQNTDYLFDIHAVSTKEGSDPFICFGEMSEEHKRLCQIIPVKRVLTDPHFLLGIPEGAICLPTTDQAVNVFGGSAWSLRTTGTKRGVALCYETGYERDMTKLPLAMLTVLNLLRQLDVIDDSVHARLSPTGEDADKAQETIRQFAPSDQHAYALIHCELAQQPAFTHATHLENWSEVKTGDVIGTYPDQTPVKAVCPGYLCFRKAESKILLGKSLFYIAQRLY